MGQRKKDLALLLVGGAVAANQFYVALAAFAIYVVANVVQSYRKPGVDPEG